jgi:hypothetical protein
MWFAAAGLRVILAGLIVSVGVTQLAWPVRGAARIEGGIESLTVEARDASLAEVLSALSARFKLQVRAPELSDQRVDGSFHGPLRWVLARLLAGRNYIAKYSDDAVEIVVLGPAGTAAKAAAPAGSSAKAAAMDQPPPPSHPKTARRRSRNNAAVAAATARAARK